MDDELLEALAGLSDDDEASVMVATPPPVEPREEKKKKKRKRTPSPAPPRLEPIILIDETSQPPSLPGTPAPSPPVDGWDADLPEARVPDPRSRDCEASGSVKEWQLPEDGYLAHVRDLRRTPHGLFVQLGPGLPPWATPHLSFRHAANYLLRRVPDGGAMRVLQAEERRRWPVFKILCATQVEQIKPWTRLSDWLMQYLQVMNETGVKRVRKWVLDRAPAPWIDERIPHCDDHLVWVQAPTDLEVFSAALHTWVLKALPGRPRPVPGAPGPVFSWPGLVDLIEPVRLGFRYRGPEPLWLRSWANWVASSHREGWRDAAAFLEVKKVSRPAIEWLAMQVFREREEAFNARSEIHLRQGHGPWTRQAVQLLAPRFVAILLRNEATDFTPVGRAGFGATRPAGRYSSARKLLGEGHRAIQLLVEKAGWQWHQAPQHLRAGLVALYDAWCLLCSPLWEAPMLLKGQTLRSQLPLFNGEVPRQLSTEGLTPTLEWRSTFQAGRANGILAEALEREVQHADAWLDGLAVHWQTSPRLPLACARVQLLALGDALQHWQRAYGQRVCPDKKYVWRPAEDIETTWPQARAWGRELLRPPHPLAPPLAWEFALPQGNAPAGITWRPRGLTAEDWAELADHLRQIDRDLRFLAQGNSLVHLVIGSTLCSVHLLRTLAVVLAQSSLLQFEFPACNATATLHLPAGVWFPDCAVEVVPFLGSLNGQGPALVLEAQSIHPARLVRACRIFAPVIVWEGTRQDASLWPQPWPRIFPLPPKEEEETKVESWQVTRLPERAGFVSRCPSAATHLVQPSGLPVQRLRGTIDLLLLARWYWPDCALRVGVLLDPGYSSAELHWVEDVQCIDLDQRELSPAAHKPGFAFVGHTHPLLPELRAEPWPWPYLPLCH